MARKPKQLYVIDDNDCWNWIGQVKRGEPLITRNSKKRNARRYYFEERYGISLDGTDRLKRTCTNKKCVNPEHYRVRTEEDRELTEVRQCLFEQNMTLKKLKKPSSLMGDTMRFIYLRAMPLLHTNDIGLIRGIVACFVSVRDLSSEKRQAWFNKQMKWLIQKEHAILKENPATQ